MAAQPHLATVSGGVANFVADMSLPLKECKVSFLPKQSGSGDPSPENVRPISGWDGLSVFVSPTTTGGTEYPVTWQSAGTVYGGYVDLVRGELVADRVMINLKWQDTERYDSDGSYQRGRYVHKRNDLITANGGVVISNVAPKKWTTAYTNYVYISATYIQLCLPVGTPDDTDIQVCAKLETPITYALTPQQITTLIGTNNIWSDAGDVELTYWSNR